MSDVEMELRGIGREDGERETWPEYEVKVRHGGVDKVFCIDVVARDEEHARVLLEMASDDIRVIGITPLDFCEGCPTCHTFGGCGAQPMKARELPRGTNVGRWISGLCQTLGRVLQPSVT